MLISTENLDWQSELDHANRAFAAMVGGQRYENITREEAKRLCPPQLAHKEISPQQGSAWRGRGSQRLLLGTPNMEMTDLIDPGSVVANLRVTSKKQALQELAKRAAELTAQPEWAIFEVLIERERLGTTGVGNGIAIPHGKLPGLDRLYALFARLETPIDFDAIDEQPVDLICVLLAPETAGADHLKALTRVSRLLRDGAICEKLRGTDSTEAIHALPTESLASHAA